MNEHMKDNAHRLISALYNHSEGSDVKRLSICLCYLEDHLHTDIFDLMDYVRELESQQKEDY